MHGNSKVAFILSGIPGSGKSTMRKCLIREYYMFDFVQISSDDYIEYFAEAAKTSYNEVFPFAYSQSTKHIKKLLDFAIATNRSIIWDQTNISKRKRKEILSNIPDDYLKISVHIDTTLEESLERNENRNRKIPEHVIKNMHDSLEIPHITEGFNKLWVRTPEDLIKKEDE